MGLCLAAYLVLWVGWAQHWAVIRQADDALLDPALEYGLTHPGWVRGWDLLCTVFTPTLWRLVLLVPIGLLLLRRRVRTALFLIVTVEGSAVLLALAKLAAGRARPDSALVSAAGSSFPSGHALGMLVIVAAVLLVVRPLLASASALRLCALLGGLIVVAVGTGRVILNVHHPSDVLAGWLLGAALVLAALPLLSSSVRPGGPSVADPTRVDGPRRD